MHAVDGVSFEVEEGSVLGIVGESGCGKSVTSLSIMGLVQSPGRVVSGAIRFEGRELTTMSDKALEDVRGKQIAMIFQDPMTSLNPTLTIGTQITETIRRHLGLSKAEARQAGDRAARGGAHPRRQAAAPRLPPSVLRGDAPTRDDRDRALVQPEAADRRRADHRARRHGPGGRARDLSTSSARPRDDDDHHLARHGRHRRDGRAGARHVRRPDRRAGVGERSLRPPRAPVHGGAPRVATPDRRPRPSRTTAWRRSRAALRISSYRPRRAASRRVASTRAPTTATRCSRSCARSALGTGYGRSIPPPSAPPSPWERDEHGRADGDTSENAHEGRAAPRGREPQEVVPDQEGDPDRPHRRLREGGRRRLVRDLPGQDARPRRRVRLRQVDDRLLRPRSC